MTNEIFYAIFGKIYPNKMFYGVIDHFNEGTPGQVQFDYDLVQKSINDGKNLIGFYHTHPNMSAYMSATDYDTMDNWVTSEGKRLLCLIEGNEGIVTFNCFNDDNWTFHCPVLRAKTFKFSNYILGWIKK